MKNSKSISLKILSQFSPLLYIFVLSIFHNSLHAQVYVQFERANTLKVKRYSPGDRISFKSLKYPGAWQSGEILEILPEDKAIVFADRISYLDDFEYLRYTRPWPNGIGTNLMRFGVAWFIFAGIIEGGRATGVLETQYEFGTDTAIIGGSAILGGFLTKKLWGTATYRMNSRNRVRIIDIRF